MQILSVFVCLPLTLPPFLCTPSPSTHLLLSPQRYYCIDDLVDAVEEQLLRLKDEHHPICRVPVITSLDEEHLIVSSSTKPVIKLLYNRGNNKYSYTP